MSGKVSCYDHAAVETLFRTIKAGLMWGIHGEYHGKLSWPSSNTSMVSTIREAATQHRVAKFRLFQLEPARGAAQKRDRSTLAVGCTPSLEGPN